MDKSIVARVTLIGIYVLALNLSQSVYAQSAPSATDVAAYTGLHKAAHDGNVEKLSSIIAAGTDLESRDTSGRTALHIAAFASHEAIVTALAHAGADLNALEYRAYDIVTIAAVANDLEVLDVALNLGADAGNISTALIAAAHLGHYKIVDRLIKSKAPLDHVNNLGWTALIEVVILGDGGPDHRNTLKLLLAAGADQTIGDGQGVTPMEHAQSRGYDDMVQLFREYQP